MILSAVEKTTADRTILSAVEESALLTGSSCQHFTDSGFTFRPILDPSAPLPSREAIRGALSAVGSLKPPILSSRVRLKCSPTVPFSREVRPGTQTSDKAELENTAALLKCEDMFQSREEQDLYEAEQELSQLQYEAKNTRREMVSVCAADLQKYVENHQKKDPLVVGVPNSKNPFVDKKGCCIL
ncbi:uncharacterized protein [Branchiostoma lanceolatum]|uniref:uncharacterized protein n=1 Tax=Branchiostoma lanceolatum TaxID=7740 RepID=UPI0034561D64